MKLPAQRLLAHNLLATVSWLLAAGALVALPRPACAADSFFDIFTEVAVTGPPYPAPAVVTLIGNNFGNGFQASQECHVAVADLDLDGIAADPPMTAHGGGGGEGVSPPGIDSFFDVFVDFDPPANGMNGRIKQDILINKPSAGTRLRLLPVNPAAPPGSVDYFFDIFVDAGFFDITYRVQDDVGFHTFHTHGTSPGARMTFAGVSIELQEPGTIDSFFDIFVDFRLCCPRDGSGAPDLRTYTTGTYDANPVPVRATTWSGIKRLLE